MRALVVEDSEDDVFFITRELKRGGLMLEVRRVADAKAMKEALAEQAWDVVISDYRIPGFGGREALSLCQEAGLDVPFIVVSGAMGDETAVEMVKAGAHDYVMKENLGRLAGSVKREVEAARDRRERRRMEEASAHLAAIVEACEDAIISEGLHGTITSWNSGAERLYGYSAEEMIGRPISLLVPADRAGEQEEILKDVCAGKALGPLETFRIRKGGIVVEVSLRISPMRNRNGEVVGSAVIARDISKRKQEERDRTQLIHELSDALAKVKTLKGLLPICAGCKKIRDDAGYWEAVESYLQKHTDAEFTHALCEDCVRRLYPDIAGQVLATG